MLASLATWEDAEPLKLRFLKTPAWSQTCAQEGEIVSWLMTSQSGTKRKAERSERFGLVRVCLAQNEPNSVCTCTPTRTTEHVFLHGYVLKKL